MDVPTRPCPYLSRALFLGGVWFSRVLCQALLCVLPSETKQGQRINPDKKHLWSQRPRNEDDYHYELSPIGKPVVREKRPQREDTLGVAIQQPWEWGPGEDEAANIWEGWGPHVFQFVWHRSRSLLLWGPIFLYCSYPVFKVVPEGSVDSITWQMWHALTSQLMAAVAYKCMYHVKCCRHVYLSLLKIRVMIFSDSQRVHYQKWVRKPYYDWKHDRMFRKGRHWSQRMLLTKRKQLTAVSCLSQLARGILCWP